MNVRKYLKILQSVSNYFSLDIVSIFAKNIFRILLQVHKNTFCILCGSLNVPLEIGHLYHHSIVFTFTVANQQVELLVQGNLKSRKIFK